MENALELLFSGLSVVFAATTACFIYSIHRHYRTVPAGSIVTSALVLLTAQRLVEFIHGLGLINTPDEFYSFFSTLLFMIAMAILAYGFWHTKLALDEYAFINKSTMDLVERFENRYTTRGAKAKRDGKKQGKW